MRTNTYAPLLLLMGVYMSLQQCCVKFEASSKRCLQCPADMHLYRDNCLYNIDNCKAYKDGFDCTQCEPDFNLVGNKCVPIPKSNCDQIKQQTIVDCSSLNHQVMIQYARVSFEILLNADVLCCSTRKLANGSLYAVAQFDATKKYIEIMGVFQDNLPNQFHFFNKQLNAKPSCQNKKCDQSKNQTAPPKNQTVNNATQNNQSVANNSQSKIPGLNQLNYKYLGPDDLKADRGFKFVDNMVHNLHEGQIGTSCKVLSVFSQKKGLSIQYIIYYQSSLSKGVFECRATYQIIKDKVYIISFDRTYIY